MSDTPPGDALGAAGECPAVEWQGKAYKLGHATQRAKDRYCEALVDAEARGVKALLDRKLISQTKHDDRLELLGQRIDRLEHKTGGPLWLEYAAGDKFLAGLHLFVWSLFAEGVHGSQEPAPDLATVREMFAGCPALLRLGIRRVLPGFFDHLAEVLRVPRETIAEAVAPVMAQLEEALARLGG